MAEPNPDPDIIHGWKAIGVVLGRSARTVQRWEQELGLPVHRIKSADGQAVYARKSELESWRAINDQAGQPSEGDHADNARQGTSWFRKRWRYAAGVIVVVGTSLAAFSIANRPEGRPAVSVRFENGTIYGESASSDRVWSKPIERHLRPAGVVQPHPFVITDIDDDNQDEFMIGLSPDLKFAANQAERPPSQLHCLRADGSVCWSVKLDLTIACGGYSFGPPWQLSAYAAAGPRGARRIWAAFVHHTWWPSVVVEIDPAGKDQPIYFQGGWVTALAQWSVGDSTYLVAGGVLNALHQASVAFVPITALPAATPDIRQTYRCDTLPIATPHRVIALPSFDVHTAGAPHPFVGRMSGLGPRLKISYGVFDPIVAEVSDDFTLVSIAQSDVYWSTHTDREREGLLDHSAQDCPERGAQKAFKYWSGQTGWVTTFAPRLPR